MGDRLTEEQVLALSNFGYCRDADCPIRADEGDGDPVRGSGVRELQ